MCKRERPSAHAPQHTLLSTILDIHSTICIHGLSQLSPCQHRHAAVQRPQGAEWPSLPAHLAGLVSSCKEVRAGALLPTAPPPAYDLHLVGIAVAAVVVAAAAGRVAGAAVAASVAVQGEGGVAVSSVVGVLVTAAGSAAVERVAVAAAVGS